METQDPIHQDFQIPSFFPGKSLLFDVTFVNDGKAKPVILFLHGFKGFKDWGTFPLMARAFARSGFVFVKMNFSFDGTTPDQMDEIYDLEAFAQNTLSKELKDIDTLINYLQGSQQPLKHTGAYFKRFYLIGHSRGGGVALLHAGRDERVKAVVSLAGVSDFGFFWPENALGKWKEAGVTYVPNRRTGQQLPLNYTLAQDYLDHKDALEIKQAVWQMNKPMLIIHGMADETLPVDMAFQLNDWYPDSELCVIDGAGHTFGAAHPWDQNKLPEHTQTWMEKAVDFLQRVHFDLVSKD